MIPWRSVTITVSADCSTARDSFLTDSSAICCSCWSECMASVLRIVRTRVAPSSCDLATQFHVPLPMISATIFSSASSVRRMKGIETPAWSNSATKWTASASPVSCSNRSSPKRFCCNIALASSSELAWSRSAANRFRVRSRISRIRKKSSSLLPTSRTRRGSGARVGFAAVNTKEPPSPVTIGIQRQEFSVIGD